ncbi:MAG: hypothetical protein FWG08_04345 [Propionibacteriaceae bacterium]|nr:hypothetical protein [Propionibacteriaceae bacterium]
MPAVEPQLLETRKIHYVRLVVNWINLSTPFGLLISVIGRAKLSKGPQGLILADGYKFSFPIASAFTVGNVIITASNFTRFTARLPQGLVHEARHSTQWAFFGPLFLPLYTLSMGISWLWSRDRAALNLFEMHAGLDDGGYKRFVRKPRNSKRAQERASLTDATTQLAHSGQVASTLRTEVETMTQEPTNPESTNPPSTPVTDHRCD